MNADQIAVINVGTSHLHFRVDGELTAQTLPRIRRALRQQLNYCRAIEVDFSEVSIVDSKSVRAILAIRREALRKDKALHFVSRNEAFLKLLESMNHAFSGAEPAI